jgi:3,4-dihydroxy 2-butanone 4-phosphate synthase/GTP cyclohydrolase II
VDSITGDCHLVLKKGEWREDEPVLVRMHSTSETGDILGVLLDDYGSQINESLQKIATEGKGVFVYLRQNDKGGLLAKLNHYKQLSADQSIDKFELHSQMGKKDFGVGAQILRDLNIAKIRLLTKHPRRMGLIGYGLEIVDHVKLGTSN